MGVLSAYEPEDTERTRLHITPFNSELLDRIVAPSMRPLASNISFHTVQTSPEGFGYIELPTMEAQKLKKKLNGSTLRGKKVRVGDAKPEKKSKVDAEADDGDRKAEKKAKKEKRKREEQVLTGHELEEGRRVKRGWTDDDAEKALKKSKRSQDRTGDADTGFEGRKLRFRADVPPNGTPLETKGKDKKKRKKDEEGKKGKKQVIVEEFKRTRKSPATKAKNDSAAPEAITYEDGKGWVDKDGNVVEAERSSRKRKHKQATQQATPQEEENAQHENGHDVEMQSDDRSTKVETGNSGKAASENDTDDHSESIGEADSPEPAKEVHPLETLFRRPASSDSTKPKPAPINTSFSFFGRTTANEDEVEDDKSPGAGMPPETPHMKQDLEWRSLRSAAPTPDTAAIGRHFSFPFAEEDDEEDDGPGNDVPGTQDAEMVDADLAEAGAEQVGGMERGEESTFRKWFYENRGDLNRGWKKRRREERKAKRQSENRRLNRKIA